MTWDPSFLERSTMFEPYARCGPLLSACADWPSRATLGGLLRAHDVRNARGVPLVTRAPADAGGASYERRAFEGGELEVRAGEWHDLMNVLVWCVFPGTKAALNERHVAASEHESGGNRGRARDALTLFDESGAIVVSSDAELLDDLREFRWKRLFWKRRERVRDCLRVFLFGHALMEKALTPYIGMTARAVTLNVAREWLDEPPERLLPRVDALAAHFVADDLATARDLAPLPVLGVPGWWGGNEAETFYDDAAYFRPGRAR